MSRRLCVALLAGAISATAATALASPAAAATVTVAPGIEIRIATSSTSANICTLGFTGTDGSGQPVGYTAGHCGDAGQQVFTSAGVNIGVIEKSSAPATGPGGVVLDSNAADWATIAFNSNADVVAGAGNVSPRTVGTPASGNAVCSQGRTTGWRCGTITDVSGYWITTTIARESGDSGGPLIRTTDQAALGVLSSTTTTVGFGSLGGADSTSRYFLLTAATDRAGAGYSVSTVNETVPDATLAPRNAPAPTQNTPVELPTIPAA